MENSIYRGKMICTYDLKDEHGIYYEDMLLEWKEAAAERVLRCVDCGAPLYLAAGPIKEPYFAHYDIEDCEYGSGQESEELKKGKRLLYQLLKRSFPDSDMWARYRLENGMYSTLFCNAGEQPIAIDYRLANNSLQNFRNKDDCYQALGIKVIYILGKRQEKDTKQLDWYQNLIQNTMGYLAFLDSKKELLILKRSFGYRLGKERHFKSCIRAYPIQELSLDTSGKILCDFDALCLTTEQLIEEEKDRYERTRDRLQELRKEKARLELEEQLRMEAYRRLQENSLNGSSKPSITLAKLTDEEILALGLNSTLYHKCVAMIERGDGHLVSKKYYDLIISS